MATSTTAGTPTAPDPAVVSPPSKPTGSEQLAHLKDLVAKLQNKVERLEANLGAEAKSVVETVKEAVGLSPAQTLRMVLMGPPGAGQSSTPSPSPTTTLWRPRSHRAEFQSERARIVDSVGHYPFLLRIDPGRLCVDGALQNDSRYHYQANPSFQEHF